MNFTKKALKIIRILFYWIIEKIRFIIDAGNKYTNQYHRYKKYKIGDYTYGFPDIRGYDGN
jgi:hypothetical protein